MPLCFNQELLRFFLRKWCSNGSVCYTLTLLFYLLTSFSQQFNVFVFGSLCCIGFSIFYFDLFQVLWMRCVKLYFDFPWMSCCTAPVWRNMISLWLLISFCLQLEHFGFANFMLLGSSLLPAWSIFFVTVSLLHFDAPCFFQYPWTLSAQEYSVLVFWSWCCFVCSVIPIWYISSLVILMRLPILRFLMNVMCSPSKMEYVFHDAADY